MAGRDRAGRATLRRRGFAALAAVLAAAPGPVLAQLLAGRARLTGPVDLSGSAGGVDLGLALSQPVPWRLRMLGDPWRIALDLRTVDWTGLDDGRGDGLVVPGAVRAVRSGQAGGGWSRLVLELDAPMGVAASGVRVDPVTGAARLDLRLVPVDAAEFLRQMAALEGSDTPPPEGARRVRPPLGQRPTVVVLDPGHGGIDPGAERGGLRESDLMLGFAREVLQALRRAGEFEVVMTRDADVFVSLEARIRIARQAGADLFVSLHADALPDGGASGATVYTLAAEASDAAAAALAERHDRADLLGGGVDLRAADDLVAGVLMDIARTETQPATDRLARTLVSTIRGAGLAMHRRPWQSAAFSVLKAPDIPSVLLEVGFMSSPRDLANLQDPAWRGRMAGAIADALARWVTDTIAAEQLGRR